MQYSAPRTVAQLHPGWNLAWRGLRIVLWLAALSYCAYRWQAGFDVALGEELQQVLVQPLFIALALLVAALMPLNWYLEARRWQTLSPALPLQVAWRGVWMGLAMSLWMPRLLGDYLGRVGELPQADRKGGIGKVFLAQATLMTSTLAVGTGGVLLYIGVAPWVAVVAVVLGLVAWPLAVYTVLRRSQRWVQRFFPSFDPESLSQNRFVRLQSLSHLRFGLFFLQYGLLLLLFLPGQSVVMLGGGIAWVYLAKATTPFLHILGDLGIREFSALLYFETLGVPAAAILTPTLLLWLLNVLVPTALGGLVWLRSANPQTR